jgi:hypothetical protein
VRERRYTGPEEAVQPGLLHEPDEATDADGMTAEEAVAEQAGQQVGDGAVESPVQEQAGPTADTAEPAATAEQANAPADAVAPEADAAPDGSGENDASADAGGSSSDAGDVEQDAAADQPA